LGHDQRLAAQGTTRWQNEGIAPKPNGRFAGRRGHVETSMKKVIRIQKVTMFRSIETKPGLIGKNRKVLKNTEKDPLSAIQKTPKLLKIIEQISAIEKIENPSKRYKTFEKLLKEYPVSADMSWERKSLVRQLAG
jgi:tRNA-dihydrouridine synthase